MRYQMILDPCEATSKSAWGTVICKADTIKELDQRSGWQGLLSDQQWHVKDTLRDKNISREEFYVIVQNIYNKMLQPGR